MVDEASDVLGFRRRDARPQLGQHLLPAIETELQDEETLEVSKRELSEHE